MVCIMHCRLCTVRVLRATLQRDGGTATHSVLQGAAWTTAKEEARASNCCTEAGHTYTGWWSGRSLYQCGTRAVGEHRLLWRWIQTWDLDLVDFENLMGFSLSRGTSVITFSSRCDSMSQIVECLISQCWRILKNMSLVKFSWRSDQ